MLWLNITHELIVINNHSYSEIRFLSQCGIRNAILVLILRKNYTCKVTNYENVVIKGSGDTFICIKTMHISFPSGKFNFV